jgi:hypothetical protein
MRHDHKIPAWQEGYNIRDFDTSRDRTFLTPVAGLWKKLIVAAVLISPGLFSVVYYRGNIPQFPELFTIFIALLAIWGIISSFFVNKVKLRVDGIQINKDFNKYFVAYSSIERAFIAGGIEQEEPHLPDGHLPLELNDKNKNAVVLVMRPGSRVESDRQGELKQPVAWIAVNVYRSASLINSIRMRT